MSSLGENYRNAFYSTDPPSSSSSQHIILVEFLVKYFICRFEEEGWRDWWLKIEKKSVQQQFEIWFEGVIEEKQKEISKHLIT